MIGTVEYDTVDALIPLLEELERLLVRLRAVAERVKEGDADD